MPTVTTGTSLGIRLGLSPDQAARLAALKTAERIQEFVNRLRWNYEIAGPTADAVVPTLNRGSAHCIEGALVAACAFWLGGRPPLLLDLGAARGDVDHVIAVFRRQGLWGAVSKSNSPFLRYRDPVYRSLRELALSFFPQYVKGRKKTLRSYSVPLDLRHHDPALWVTRPGFCHEIVDALTGSRHYAIVSGGAAGRLRPIDTIEQRANRLREYPKPPR